MDWRADRMNGHPGEQGEGDRCMRLWRPERRAQQTTLGFTTRMPEPLADAVIADREHVGPSQVEDE